MTSDKEPVLDLTLDQVFTGKEWDKMVMELDALTVEDLDLDIGDLDLEIPNIELDMGAIEMDMGNISLDFGDIPTPDLTTDIDLGVIPIFDYTDRPTDRYRPRHIRGRYLKRTRHP